MGAGTFATMRLDLSTRLPCTLEQAAREVMTPQRLAYVAAPLLRLIPLDPNGFPPVWGRATST